MRQADLQEGKHKKRRKKKRKGVNVGGVERHTERQREGVACG